MSATDRPMRLPWPPILFLSCLGGGLLLQLHLSGAIRLASGVADRVAAGVVIGIGLALIVWAIRTMLAARTEIRPDRAATSLIEAGPFRHTRNPIYEGEAIVLAGLAFLLLSPVLAMAALVFVIGISRLVRLEERHLELRFGEAYRDYCARVPRFLLGGRLRRR